MKKRLITILIFIITILCFSQFGIESFSLSASAASYSNASNVLYLVGYKGYSPFHYFDNLYEVKADSTLLNYYNRNNEKVNDYYVIKSQVTSLENTSIGASTSIKPYGDYIPLANSGSLYAKLQAGIYAGTNTSHSRVQLNIKSGNNTSSAINSDVGSVTNFRYSPYYYETNYIQISPDNDLKASFFTVEKGNFIINSSFYLFEPRIYFKTNLDSVYFDNENSEVYNGSVIKLNAYNDISNIKTSSNLIDYYKNIHKIEYEIIEGANCAKIVGEYIYFSGNASQTVKIRAKCRKSSENDEIIYSDIVTFNYKAEMLGVSVKSNFADCATFVGEGGYSKNDIAFLYADIKSGYKFLYWIVNGEKITDNFVSVEVTEDLNIEYYCQKTISISTLSVEEKVYDMTTDATLKGYTFNGVEHDGVKLTNLLLKFDSSNVGENKNVTIQSIPTLEGDNAVWYNLSKNYPQILGEIIPKDAYLTLSNNFKIYGDVDSKIEGNLSGIYQNDSFKYTLTRETGENVGNYKVSLHSDNTNYKVYIENDYYQIKERELKINGQISKIYDKTTILTINPALLNVVEGDDVSLALYGNFEDCEVGEGKVANLSNFVISGNDSLNYTFDLNANAMINDAQILPREVNLSIVSNQKIYGDDDSDVVYTLENVIEGDDLGLQISREEGEEVGLYKYIAQITNKNYKIITNNAYLNILPKEITVSADYLEKTYGELDPILTYTIQGLCDNDNLQGSLIRSNGEDVGEYEITLGTLSNSNYNIKFNSNVFKINKRNAKINLQFNNKEYDGTTDACCDYNLENVIVGDNVEAEVVAVYENKNVGENIEVYLINLQSLNSNYNLVYEQTIYYANIIKRNVEIRPDKLSKIYGEEDSKISFTAENLVEGETLQGDLSRISGETVGDYQVTIGDIEIKNTNYSFILLGNVSYSITKRTIYIESLGNWKFYGDKDPEPTFVLCENSSLVFDDKLYEIFSGVADREIGETPGVYDYLKNGLILLNNNYQVEISQQSFLTIKKLPVEIYANSAEKVYGEKDPVLNFSYNNELCQTLSLKLTREYGENVGKYKILCLDLTNECFEITFISEYLTINPRSITLGADYQSKEYGSKDPVLSYSIKSGNLVFDDKLPIICKGNLCRESGEIVGFYDINIGDLEISQNYQMSFESGQFEIKKHNIQIQAKNLNKYYYSLDPELEYDIISGELKFEDVISGEIERQKGENIGLYDITQGSLKINENYNIEFINGIFEILKRPLTIKISGYSKFYGESDPSISYEILGEMKEGDFLTGSISRQAGETAGEYEIYCSLDHECYDIIYDCDKFIINKRILVVQADSFSVKYGEEFPVLTYQIIEGNLLEGDFINGEIYKIYGNNVGNYEIRSSLYVDKNYSITFIKGTFTILPCEIMIKGDNVEKIYGDRDPEFTYQIVKGEVYNKDDLNLTIIREAGENVGQYYQTCNVANKNYNASFESGSLTILPKQIMISTIAKDKVYDGTKKANIRVPSVSGLIDNDVVLKYDINNCAEFVIEEVGNDIEVVLFNIVLTGEKSANYQLIYPKLTANITHSSIEKENISISSSSAVLLDGTSIEINDLEITQTYKNKIVVKKFEINLINGNEKIDTNETITYKIHLDNEWDDLVNFKVYKIDETGEKTLIQCKLSDGNLTFSTSGFGRFEIIADSDEWLNIASVTSVGIILVIVSIIVIGFIRKKRKTK